MSCVNKSYSSLEPVVPSISTTISKTATFSSSSSSSIHPFPIFFRLFSHLEGLETLRHILQFLGYLLRKKNNTIIHHRYFCYFLYKITHKLGIIFHAVRSYEIDNHYLCLLSIGKKKSVTIFTQDTFNSAYLFTFSIFKF